MSSLARVGTRVGVVAVMLLLVGVLWWFDSDTSPEPAPGAGDRAGVSSAVTGDMPGTESMPEVDESGIPYVDLRDLPAEAGRMVVLIDAGGPYEYAGKDGSTFGNYEGRLPPRRRGYYREYTVETPGLDHRGARRIVTGDGGEFYWTADHYESFERIWR